MPRRLLRKPDGTFAEYAGGSGSGGGSSGGDAMRLKAMVEVPYEGTPTIGDMIDFTRKYTFADIAEAFVAGRTITLNTEYDVVPFQYGMFLIHTIGSRGFEFHGHYWRVKDVEADVDEGWVPAVAFLREDGTLTVEDREWSGYAKQAEVDSLSEAIADLELGGNAGTVSAIQSVLYDIVTFLKAVPFDDTVASASDLDNIKSKIDALGTGGGTDEPEQPDEPDEPDTPDEPIETISATFSNGELVISGVTVNSATFSDGVLAVA